LEVEATMGQREIIRTAMEGKHSYSILTELLAAQAKNFLDWLSPYAFSAKRQTLMEQHIVGTGAWFVQNAKFQGWENGTSSSILWCKGRRTVFEIFG